MRTQKSIEHRIRCACYIMQEPYWGWKLKKLMFFSLNFRRRQQPREHRSFVAPQELVSRPQHLLCLLFEPRWRCQPHLVAERWESHPSRVEAGLIRSRQMWILTDESLYGLCAVCLAEARLQKSILTLLAPKKRRCQTGSETDVSQKGCPKHDMLA